jgi:hypothetical protein
MPVTCDNTSLRGCGILSAAEESGPPPTIVPISYLPPMNESNLAPASSTPAADSTPEHNSDPAAPANVPIQFLSTPTKISNPAPKASSAEAISFGAKVKAAFLSLIVAYLLV